MPNPFLDYLRNSAAIEEITSIRPILEAQAMELRLRWEADQQPSDLKPGDICVEKRGMGNLTAEARANRVMIIWRMLNLDVWLDRQLVMRLIKNDLSSTDRPDCLVGVIHDDGTVVNIMPHQRSQLELWISPAAED